MPNRFSDWVTKIITVFKKEIKSEFRTRYAFNSLAMFAVVTLTVLSLAVGQFALTDSVKSALLWVVLFLGSVGLASTTTIIAAIVSKTDLKGTLLTILSFPLLLPVLGISIQGTKVAVTGAPFYSGFAEVKFLFSYIVVMLTASLLLFETVWME